MSRIADCFKALAQKNQKALIPFFTAGDPSPDIAVPLMHTLVESGADIIELGVPFSDPMAEGPVIQRASERALEQGMSLKKVLQITAQFRQENQHTPIVLMGYLNPIEVTGYEVFAQAAAEAGVDACLTVDLPPEEAQEYVSALKMHNIAPIFLLAPTSPKSRIKAVSDLTDAFIYYVSLKGVTGANRLDTQAVAEKITEIRAITDKPLAVGFGIKDPESASQMAKLSDAVVVGSALVDCIETAYQKSSDNVLSAVSKFIKELKQAI